MDDRFLHEGRRAPREEFAEELRGRLAAQGPARPAWRPAWAGRRLAPALSLAAAAVAVAALFTLPSVRASAQAFLDLFRVRGFAAVAVDEARMAELESRSIDIKGMLGERVETLEDPGPARVVADAAAAGAAAGFTPRVPALLPRGLAADTVFVQGQAVARLTVDLDRLRRITESLGIDDAPLPANLDGAPVTVRVPPAVGMTFRSERARVLLVQAPSPEVRLPPGADLARLGELALRIAGLSPAEARRFAQSVDWSGTLLVPVPASVGSFREVHVGGSRALLVTTTGRGRDAGRRRRPDAILMWSEADRVYALCGNLDEVSLLEMAGSLR